jgi:hypothetical protein
MDETYKRKLQEILKADRREHAHRLLRSLIVDLRPLNVEKLAEVLTMDFAAVRGGFAVSTSRTVSIYP